MRGRVVRRGGELVVVIPEHDQLEENAEVEIVPVSYRPTIEELVAGITDENRHEETDWGPPVGNELW
jgi:antitoxin MazE